MSDDQIAEYERADRSETCWHCYYERDHACPTCGAVLNHDDYACDQCQQYVGPDGDRSEEVGNAAAQWSTSPGVAHPGPPPPSDQFDGSGGTS